MTFSVILHVYIEIKVTNIVSERHKHNTLTYFRAIQ